MPTPTNSLYARLFNDIKIAIPGAIDAVIYQELWRVIEDFLNQTNIWQEEIPFNVNPQTRTYEITPVGKGSIDRLLMVFDPASSWPEKRWVQQGVTFSPPNRINVMYQPSTATMWMAAVSKNIDDKDIPTDPGAVTLPVFEPDATWIIDRYRDAFRYGTLGYLMMQPAKPYSNPKLGGYNWQNYMAERGRARTEVLHANVYGGQRWMYPQGYATTARKGWT
jgi:hypothetical protein